MAPKFRNPFKKAKSGHGESSGSHDPSAEEVEILFTPHGRNQWDPNFRQRLVIPGRQIDLSAAYDRYLVDFLRNIDWEPILTLPSRYFPMAVRYFYCNLSHTYDTHRGLIIRSKVYGVDIELDRLSLATILGLSLGDVICCPTTEGLALDTLEIDFTDFYGHLYAQIPANHRMAAKDLRPRFRLLRKYLAENIVPKKGHFDEVPVLMSFIIYCLDTSVPLDLSHIILTQMEAVHSSPNRGLIFGALLTKVFHHFNVPLQDAGDVLPQAINQYTVDRGLSLEGPVDEPVGDQGAEDVGDDDDFFADIPFVGEHARPPYMDPFFAQQEEMLQMQRDLNQGQQQMMNQFAEFSLYSHQQFDSLGNRIGRLEDQVGPMYQHYTQYRPPPPPPGPYYPGPYYPYPPP